MLRTSVRTGALISGGAAIVLLLAGCGSGGTAGQGSPDVPSIPGSSATSTAPPAPTSAAPPATTAPSPAPGTTKAEQPQAGPVAGTTTECKVPDLKVSLGGGDSAAGTTYRAVVFTNKGTRTCTVQGFPGVSYVTGDDGHQVGPAAYRTGAKGALITLKPGGSASADVGFVQVRNFDAGVCRPTEVRGLRIYPPHEYNSVFLPAPGTGCAGTPPGNQLTVATLK
jgi:uncharacterized protein DUF4232